MISVFYQHFDQIKISVKGFDVPMTVDAYTRLSDKVDYPLHLGITEAGAMASFTFSQVRRSVDGWFAMCFQKLFTSSTPRVDLMSSYTACTSCAASE